jgi:hypothetical protein
VILRDVFCEVKHESLWRELLFGDSFLLTFKTNVLCYVLCVGYKTNLNVFIKNIKINIPSELQFSL